MTPRCFKILLCSLFVLALMKAHPVVAKKKSVGFTTYESLQTPKSSRELAEPGKFTIVEYYVDWCETCKLMPNYYQLWLANKPDTVIKRVHLPNDFDFASVSKRHWIQLCGTPHFEIIAADGTEFLKDRCQDNAAFQYVFKTIYQMQDAAKNSK